jgi:hypothetical protein
LRRIASGEWSGVRSSCAAPTRYLLQMTIPNTFFHIAMAYAILRHNGVDVGKMDFLGPIYFVVA